jgi:signal transduction histidine kinase
MKRLAVLVGLTLLALLLAEIVMQPGAGDRRDLFILFSGLAIGAGIAAWEVPRRVARMGSLRHAVLVVAFSAVITIMLAIVVSSSLMFLSPHDFRLLAVVVVLAAGLSTVVAVAVARDTTTDLKRIGETAAEVAAGDLEARTMVDRPDEVGLVARSLDEMTEKLAEASLQRTQDEAERSMLLAAVGHDLRTPLAALRATVEALEDGIAPDPAKYLTSMRRDVDALGHLVDELFLLARLESGRFVVPREEVDLTELADEAIEALSPVAVAAEIALELHVAERVMTHGAAPELGRVVRNLIENAVRHSPKGGTVSVEVSANGSRELCVTDEGPGFSPDFIALAFEPFTREDSARGRDTGGAGLGLAIARGVIEAHGGEIWARPGPGGQVGFHLPA